jgi:hypothetical protein
MLAATREHGNATLFGTEVAPSILDNLIEDLMHTAKHSARALCEGDASLGRTNLSPAARDSVRLTDVGISLTLTKDARCK